MYQKGWVKFLENRTFANVKYGKLNDGEQQVLVFLKVLWYANKCIVTEFRIHLFSGQKMTFERDGSKFVKIAPLQCKIW